MTGIRCLPELSLLTNGRHIWSVQGRFRLLLVSLSSSDSLALALLLLTVRQVPMSSLLRAFCR
jgi:hypothetical protein